ncbi:MAG: alpha/beta hydrolase [Rhizobiaceae bacterium]
MAGFNDVFYSAQDGLTLHARVYGRTQPGLPAICLPGLTRNARDFHELALHLSTHIKSPRPVVAFDYRGRGQSAWAPDWTSYDPLVEAGDVLAGLAALDIGHGLFIGTSRGGLITMILSAMRPGAIRGAILNDIGPRIEGEGLAQIRAYLTGMPAPASLAEAEAILKQVFGPAFLALSDPDWARMAAAIFAERGGRIVPDYDPALINPLKSVDFSQPLPELWPQFEGLAAVPLMTIRGANSRLLSPATLAEMERRHPGMETITVEGQGHAPLLETGDLPERIAAFAARLDQTH